MDSLYHVNKTMSRYLALNKMHIDATPKMSLFLPGLNCLSGLDSVFGK